MDKLNIESRFARVQFWIASLLSAIAGLFPLSATDHLNKSNVAENYTGHFQIRRAFHESVRMPGDFEKQQGIAFAAGGVSERFAKMIADIADEVAGKIEVLVLVNSQADYFLVKRKIEERQSPKAKVTFVHAENDTCWIRDYGPTCVDNGRASRWIDWLYDEERPNDDEIPDTILNQTGLKSKFIPLSIEGGNILSNGCGIILTSERVFDDNPQTYTEDDAVLELANTLNASDVVVLEPLYREDTGHVDMFAVFTDAETVFVASCDEVSDRKNAAILDRNASRLSDVITSSGKRLNVVRIPMDKHDDGVWRTYTNCIFANGVVIVPTYKGGDRKLEERAMQLYRRHLPGWKVVGMDASYLIESGGAFRCASLSLYRTHRPFRSVKPDVLPLDSP